MTSIKDWLRPLLTAGSDKHGLHDHVTHRDKQDHVTVDHAHHVVLDQSVTGDHDNKSHVTPGHAPQRDVVANHASSNTAADQWEHRSPGHVDTDHAHKDHVTKSESEKAQSSQQTSVTVQTDVRGCEELAQQQQQESWQEKYDSAVSQLQTQLDQSRVNEDAIRKEREHITHTYVHLISSHDSHDSPTNRIVSLIRARRRYSIIRYCSGCTDPER